MPMRLPLLAIGLSAIAAGCDTALDIEAGTVPASAPPSPEAWREIASRTVLFGHQSVGRNILDGVRELMAESDDAPLRLVTGADPSRADGPVLVEFAVGENGDPGSKAVDFAAAVDRFAGTEKLVALYKHCYLDVTPETDPDAMFRAYAEGADELLRRHPGLTLVHVTLPLTTVESAPERLVRSLLGRTTRLELNAKRTRFNRLLRERYAGRAPVFDLAAIESTQPDGRPRFVEQRGDTVYALAEAWTDDGGHLNRAGSRVAAASFLALLSRL